MLRPGILQKGIFSLVAVCILGSWAAWADPKVEKLFVAPYREISLIVSPEGYYPSKITAFEGEKVRFFVTSIGATPNCFIINEKNIFLAATAGKVTEGEAYFESPGILTYSCPSTKIEGKIVILSKKHKAERSVAQVKNRGKVWRPKDVPDDWSESRGE